MFKVLPVALFAVVDSFVMWLVFVPVR